MTSPTEAQQDFSILSQRIDNSRKLVISNNDLPHPSAEEYNMNHDNRGLALLFNHYEFKQCPSRKGTNLDRDNISKLLRDLKFEVKIYNDLNASEINITLRTVSKMDHSTSDCLVVVIMTHGDERTLYARDDAYPTNRLWKYFSANICPSLAGKPKLFFIQACRGTNMDPGVSILYKQIESDSEEYSQQLLYSIPIMSDILIMYSTVDGYYSWRSPTEGSFFIRSLVQQLEQHYETKDLLTILTGVNRQVATEFSIYEANKKESDWKQMCSIVSMLTRLVYFNK